MGKKENKRSKKEENTKKHYCNSEYQKYSIVNQEDYVGMRDLRLEDFRDVAVETVRNGIFATETEVWVEKGCAYGVSETLNLDSSRPDKGEKRRYIRIPTSTRAMIVRVMTIARSSLSMNRNIHTMCKIERIRFGKKRTVFFTEGDYNGDEVPDIFYKCLEFNTQGMKKIEFDDLEEDKEKEDHIA